MSFLFLQNVKSQRTVSYTHLTKGIEETRRIQEDARKKRQEDQVRLEAIKQDFNKQYNVPPVRK